MIKSGQLTKIIDEMITTRGTVGTTTNTATSNIANAASQTSTVTNKPKTPQEVDAIAQMLKNAGLSSTQLQQVSAKAKAP